MRSRREGVPGQAESTIRLTPFTASQIAHLREAGYVIVRVDDSLADQVAFHSGVDHGVVQQVLDTLRTLNR